MYKNELIIKIHKYMDMGYKFPYDITNLMNIEIEELKYRLEIMKLQATNNKELI